ncbi:COG3650 family protein [Novosphingobium aquiterrae]|uniref:COG3650 family protein n=1 Tax=Novosphingobium aquiterrae TaxID=624388 RepID=A0ABV6PMB8_9SPHN
MRSAALLGLLALAGCGQPKPDSAEPRPAPSQEATATAPSAPAVKPSPTPTPTPTPKVVAAPKPAPSPTATPAAKPKPEKRLQAIGTEPFWSVDVMPKGRLKYVTPDMVNGVMVSAIERRKGERITFTARFNGKPFTLDLVPAKCSDGMSDVVYPWTVTFVHSGRTDHGCARMR